MATHPLSIPKVFLLGAFLVEILCLSFEAYLQPPIISDTFNKGWWWKKSVWETYEWKKAFSPFPLLHFAAVLYSHVANKAESRFAPILSPIGVGFYFVNKRSLQVNMICVVPSKACAMQKRKDTIIYILNKFACCFFSLAVRFNVLFSINLLFFLSLSCFYQL